VTTGIHYLNEQNILIFLIQVLLLLGLARGLGEMFRRWNQPPLTAEIFVGILLGPSILGRFFPQIHNFIFPPDPIQQSMLETLAWLGVLFLLLQTGLEIDFSSAWRQKGDALKIALLDVIIPMVIAFVPCMFLPDRYLVDPDRRLSFAIFMATAMTISAMPIAARALHDLKLLKTDLGLLIMSALSVNDIIGWLIFTLVLGFFTQSQIYLGKMALILGATIGFTVFCMWIGRSFSDHVISEFKKHNMPEPASSLTFICLLGLLCGTVTQLLGIHALFGFFVAGMMAGEARALSERTRQVISQMVFAIFVPLFFAGIGLKIDFFQNFDIFLALFVTVIGIAGRFAGAWLGVSLTRLSRDNRLAISIAHTPGGAMEIVIGVLALETGLITQPVFIAIVFGAIVSSVVFGPWMNYSLKRRKVVSILEFFSKRNILPGLKAADRDRAIEELCERVAEEENLPPQAITAAVIQREEIMGTAVEEQVALPHARLRTIRKPVIAFGRSSPGLEWNSPDGQMSHFIFLILTGEDDHDIQVQILRAIAKVMSDPRARTAIIRAKNDEEIWDILRRAFTTYHVKQK
jgi:Kef-type K+ transport system membrane component KefB